MILFEIFHKKDRVLSQNTSCKLIFSLEKRTALFWIIMQQVVLISYRRFGTTFRSLEDGTDSLSRKAGKKLPRCVIAQNSAVLIYRTAEA